VGNTGDVVSSGIGRDETSNGSTTQELKKDPNEIVYFAEQMPSFPGGAQALSKYLGRKFDCNDSNHNGFSREGKIILKFVVMKDGTIKDISVLQETVSIDCVEQAKQILLNGPKWNPGKQNNEAVNVVVVQPITFAVE
jgi:protein TonB